MPTHTDLEARAIADAIIARISESGREDPIETVRRVREVKDQKVRARVLALLSEHRSLKRRRAGYP